MNVFAAIVERPIALLAIAALMLLVQVDPVRDSARKIREHRRAVADRVFAHDRFVDASVRLCVVVADEANGEELLPDKPKLRIVREYQIGGVIDTHATPPRIDPSRECRPVTWYCSEDQEPVILHGDHEALCQLVYGSMGAGKTAALVMWLYCRWMEFLGRPGAELGVTAPTDRRMTTVVLPELRRWWPHRGRPRRGKPPELRWGAYRAGDGTMRMVDGTLIHFVSTYQQSEAAGSRLQGLNLWALGSDEMQDSLNEAAEMEIRGRAAPKGRYKRLVTATAKDSYEWRTYRDTAERAVDGAGKKLWIRRTLKGERSPFVDPTFWRDARAKMSPRMARMKLDALDVGPERATYPTWDREKNLINVPDIGWTDVTARELAPYLDNATVLGGHDPGTLQDITELLKAFVDNHDFELYRRGLVHPRWVVMDEVTTEGTKDIHISRVLELVRTRWRCNFLDARGRQLAEDGPRLFVRCDPAGDSDSKVDESVYTTWRNNLVTIRPGAWSKSDPTAHGRVPKDAGIEVINTLLCNGHGQRRLFVARKPDGTPAAPMLVKAFETSERDLAGKAETQLKRKGDLSHWPSGLRYALWLIERPRLQLPDTRGLGNGG